MGILRYILFLGLINILFGFIWKWVVLVPTSFLFALLRFNIGARIVKIIGAYFLVSLTALLSLAATIESSVLYTIFIFFVGAFVLFLGFSTNTYETKKQAINSRDEDMYRFAENDAYLTLGSLILYILIGFFPRIAPVNHISNFFDLCDWALNIKVLGWLLGFLSILFLLNVLYYGLLAVGGIIGSIVGIFSQKKQSDNENNLIEESIDEQPTIESNPKFTIPSKDTEDIKLQVESSLQGVLSNLYINSTANTPVVVFETNGELSITGRSTPEDAEYLLEIQEWISEYIQHPANLTLLEIELDCINDITRRWLRRAIQQLSILRDKGYHVKVNWYFQDDDNDLFEQISAIEKIVDVPIVKIARVTEVVEKTVVESEIKGLPGLTYKPTTRTPFVQLQSSGKLEITGDSIPNEVSSFYEDILDWCIAYCSKDPPKKTTIDFNLDLCNSGTKLYLIRIFKKLGELSDQNLEVILNWYYNSSEDNMKEFRDHIIELMIIPISLHPTKNQ